jgi:hypothetical protein
MTRHDSLRISLLRPAIGLVLCACVAGCQPGKGAAATGAIRIVPQPPGNPSAAPAASMVTDSRFDAAALRPRIPIDPADTLLQVVNLSVDKDAEEEQVIAVKRSDDVESPVRLIVADADPARGAYYYQSWESPTNSTDSRAFTLAVKDLLGEHDSQIVASGTNGAGKLTLDVFRRVPSAAAKDVIFRPVCQLVADDISIEETERADSYSSDTKPGPSFPIVAYLRDPESQNVMDLVRIRYTWNSGEARYVPSAPEKIPGEKVQQTQLQALYNSTGQDAFEQFISGSWVQIPSTPGVKGRAAPPPSIINFDPRGRKIAIGSGNTQEVYLWRTSLHTLYNMLIVDGENETVLDIHLKRRFTIVVDSMTSLSVTTSGGDTEDQRTLKYVRVTDDIRTKLLERSGAQALISPLVLDGTYKGANVLRVEFKAPALTWTTASGTRSGTYVLFTLGPRTILTTRFPGGGSGPDDIASWLVDFREKKDTAQVVRTLALSPVVLTINGYVDTNGDPQALEQAIDLKKK